MPRLSRFEMALRARQFRSELRKALSERGLTPLDIDYARPLLVDARVPFTPTQIRRPSRHPIERGCELAEILITAFMTAQLESHIGRICYRGVANARLDRVLGSGIDVEPTTAPFFASLFAEKALKYGGSPKVMIVLHASALDRTSRDLDARTSARGIAAVRENFPTRFELEDHSKIRFSRFYSDSVRTPLEGEDSFGFWIPGDAKRAIVAALRIESELDSG